MEDNQETREIINKILEVSEEKPAEPPISKLKNNLSTNTTIDNIEKPLIQSIIEENDEEKLKEMIQLFNNIQKKKSIIRISKFGELLDESGELLQFKLNSPEELNIKELSKIASIASRVLGDADKTLNATSSQESPTPVKISQNNTNVTIQLQDAEGYNQTYNLKRDSRFKVINLIKEFYKELNENTANGVIDVESESKEDSNDKESE